MLVNVSKEEQVCGLVKVYVEMLEFALVLWFVEALEVK